MDEAELDVGREILNDVANIPSGARAALVIRHSIRGEITTPENEDVQLNSEGILAARRFGTRLKWASSIVAVSSQKTRCRQTAREILDGFASANPGIEVSLLDSHKSVAALLHAKSNSPAIDDIVSAIHRSGSTGNYRGFGLPPSLAVSAGTIARQVISSITNDLEGTMRDELHLFVDHDLHLMLLRQQLFGEGYRRREWIDFLDGFVIYLLDGSVFAACHGMTVAYKTAEDSGGTTYSNGDVP
ncbi:MAG: histidine phosphatase family protein [Thermoplasmata archaeon YP2-bin.285]|uniref:Histidine phosphatase family protein n=1 Tax=Candidatus Sysuiplasma superficiale TaxID=2823368 RepID=A0A8J7YL19_9ARCH|nr:histidine phosphatase family protein [Candidatus Sysuiplasma superficiale]